MATHIMAAVFCAEVVDLLDEQRPANAAGGAHHRDGHANGAASRAGAAEARRLHAGHDRAVRRAAARRGAGAGGAAAHDTSMDDLD